jgi:hypothetical protein
MGKSPMRQPFEAVLSNFIETTIVMMDWRFVIAEQVVPANAVASNHMTLGPILWQAEKTHQLLCGKSTGVQFRPDAQSSVGAVAVIQEHPGISRASYPLFCLEVLCHALENHTLEGGLSDVSAVDIRDNILMGRRVPPKGCACSLDHLIQSFFNDHERGLLPWTADSNPKVPNLSGG